MSAEVAQRVVAVFREVLAIEEESIDPNASIKGDLGADSLDQLSLFMALEDEFGGTISEQEAAKLTTVGDVIGYISSRLEESAVAQ
ncbi:MAG: acyl carrier protein [Gammaproteobacteria bacterium]|nr:acyl carrier protein [Gammaproteobacteria bacterium]